MIMESDRAMIARLAAKYGVRRVLLFGSSADSGRMPHDIDLAVEGLNPRRFFEFYGELLTGLSLPVDLFDLTQAGKFADLVRKEGLPLYG